MSAIVVVGASGFVGSAVVRQLTAGGGKPICVGRRELEAEFQANLLHVLAEAREIIWLAGAATPRRAEADPAVAAADIAALSRVLDARRMSRSAARLTMISTGGALYDPRLPPPYSEQSPVAPSNAYGRSRWEMEEMLRQNWSIGDCIARVANVYGPGQRDGTGQGVIAHWIAALTSGDTLPLVGSARVRRDYVFIDDVAAAFNRLSSARVRPPVVNIGSGRPTSLLEIAELLGRLTDREPRFERLPARVCDAPDNWLDVSLARLSIGWSSDRSLREGLAATVACAPEHISCP